MLFRSRWFANGDSHGLAAWIADLRDHPAQARSLGQAARRLLLDQAHPERICDAYLQRLAPHLPEARRPAPRPAATAPA